MFVVQAVEILWTKATRGAPRSKERAGLPRAFQLSGAPGEYVIERYRVAEWEGFVPKRVAVEAKNAVPRSEGVLCITLESEGACRLGISGAPNSGRPKRYSKPRIARLGEGEYVRLLVNARHASYSGQYYSETIFNVAYGDVVPENLFVAGRMDREIDLKEMLF